MLLMAQHGCCYISSPAVVCGNGRRRMRIFVARQAAISKAVRTMAASGRRARRMACILH